MRKRIALILALVLCLFLTACGKSEAVKSVEATIKNLGEISAESLDAVFAARKAYEALTEEEQEKVKNIDELKEAYAACVMMHLPGNWVYNHENYNNIEDLYERVDLTISEDFQVTSNSANGPCRVEDFRLMIDNGEYNHVYYLYCDNGQLTVGSVNSRMMKQEAFTALLDDMFVTVALTPENIADYCNIVMYTEIEQDDFGVITGDTRTYVALESTVYDDGLIYLENSDDLAVELLIPEHPYTYTKGSRVRKYTDEADDYVIKHGPYSSSGHSLGYKRAEDGYEYVHDITADQISFGRVTGSITFIRAEYVEDVYKAEDSSSRRILLKTGKEIYSGTWRQDTLF